MTKCTSLMSHDVSCCLPESSAEQVAEVMKHSNVGCLPVVADFQHKEVIGIITDRDLALRVIAERRDPHRTTAKDIMTRHIVSCNANDSIDGALALMEHHRIRRLPVVGTDNQLIGIISEADVATKLNEPAKTAELAKAISTTNELP